LQQRKKVTKNAAASDPDYRFVRFCKAKPTKSNIGTFLTLHELIFLTHFFRGGSTCSGDVCYRQNLAKRGGVHGRCEN